MGAKPAQQPVHGVHNVHSVTSTFSELSADAALVLIVVACGLLDRQLEAQAAAFEREGGFMERLYGVRRNTRGLSN